jgi:hypothetical protein
MKVIPLRHPIDIVEPAPPRAAVGGFVVMVSLWMVFWTLLVASPAELDGVWGAARDLHVAVELVVWVLALPWILGLTVWASSWAEWLRLLVICGMSVGWSIAFFPRRG